MMPLAVGRRADLLYRDSVHVFHSSGQLRTVCTNRGDKSDGKTLHRPNLTILVHPSRCVCVGARQNGLLLPACRNQDSRATLAAWRMPCSAKSQENGVIHRARALLRSYQYLPPPVTLLVGTAVHGPRNGLHVEAHNVADNLTWCMAIASLDLGDWLL